jgi:hypothetical protein
VPNHGPRGVVRRSRPCESVLSDTGPGLDSPRRPGRHVLIEKFGREPRPDHLWIVEEQRVRIRPGDQ